MAKKLTKKRKAEIMFSDAYVTITSREIAEMTGKEHYDVLKDIRKISDEINFPVNNHTVQTGNIPAGRFDQVTDIFYEHYYQIDGKGKKYPMYVLGQFMADMVLTSYSAQYRMVLIRELYSRRATAKQWCESRENLRHEHWELTSHIERLSTPNEEGEVRRDENGKRLAMRYSTELDMMNKIVLGMNAKKFKLENGVDNVRDILTDTQIKILDDIQKYNLTLLNDDKGYYERKDILSAFSLRLKLRYQNQLLGE